MRFQATLLMGLLAAPRSEVLSPIYRGEANVHGLGFSPDHRTVVQAKITTNIRSET